MVRRRDAAALPSLLLLPCCWRIDVSAAVASSSVDPESIGLQIHFLLVVDEGENEREEQVLPDLLKTDLTPFWGDSSCVCVREAAVEDFFTVAIF